jgi:hypothetical protein
MAIFEEIVPNSGFKGGKFLQRTRVRDPETGQFFEPSAFYIGAFIRCSARVFELLDAAPHTLNLMEAHSDDFPEANITTVVQSLTSIALQDTKSVRELFEAYDPQKTGYVGIDEAKQIFAKFVPKITKHAVLTLARAFDKGDGTYEYALLLKFMRA